MNTRTIYTGPADGWHLAITARAGMGRWIVKFEHIKSSRVKSRIGAWLADGRWHSTLWSPDLGSEARAIAETWLLANPVPVFGAGVKP
ncbi:MAG: hypothetical protein LW834_06720 [Cyanobium sp. 49614_E6]|jgi:hypothetical protein|nr:hypothetical protein [Cyanobium sp. 49614_E6]